MSTLSASLVPTVRFQEKVPTLPLTRADQSIPAAKVQTEEEKSMKRFLAALLRSLGTFAA
jgi:hypothetical protein